MMPSLSVVAGEHQCPLLTSSVAEAKVTDSVAAADRIVVVVPDEPPQPNAGAASALLKLVRNRRVLQRAFNSRVCC